MVLPNGMGVTGSYCNVQRHLTPKMASGSKTIETAPNYFEYFDKLNPRNKALTAKQAVLIQGLRCSAMPFLFIV